MSTVADHILPAPASVADAPRASRAAAPATFGAAQPVPSIWWAGLVAAFAWAALGLLTYLWPNKPAGFSEWEFTHEFALGAGVVAVA